MYRKLFGLLLFFLSVAIHGQNTEDQEAYRLLSNAHKHINECRYVEAYNTIQRADKLENVFSITKAKIRSAYLRILLSLGDYTQARDLYRTALLNSPDEECDDELRLIFSEYGFLTGDYKSALAELDSIRSPGYILKALNHRVRLLTFMEDYDKAISLADSLLSLQGQNKEEYAYIKQNKGYAYWLKNDADNAIPALRSAIALLSNGADKYNIQGNLALIESESGDCENALRDISEVLRHLGTETSDGIINLRKEAEILLRCSNKEKTDEAFRRYVFEERKSLIKNLSQMSATQKLNYWVKEKPLLSKCFLLEDYDAEFLFDVAMLRRQTSLLGLKDTVDLKHLLHVTSKDVRRNLRYDEVAIEIVSYESIEKDTVYAAIILPKTGKARFIRLLKNSELYEPKTVKTNSLLNAIIGENEQEKNALYTDTVWGNRIWQPILKNIPKGVSKLYFAPEGIFHLLAIENLPYNGEKGLEMHRLTSIASLTNRQKKKRSCKNKMLVIGGLNYNILPKDYTTDSIHNHEAANLLITKGGITGDRPFTYLRGTKDEVDSIRKIMTSAKFLYETSESSLKSHITDYDFIHLATHGYSLNIGIRRRPEIIADSIPFDNSLTASGLALTGANIAIKGQNGQDEILSAREICDLDLSQVDFVVLSACQTAKGDITDEGAAGLVRGLKNAGVKTILATLWSVDDTSTMIFMQEFYKALSIGKSKYESYIQAQSYLRNHVKQIAYRKFSPKTMSRGKKLYYREQTFSDPYYWAPFILIDEY